MTVIEFLKEEKINSSLIEGIMEFRASHPVREEDRGRIPVPGTCIMEGTYGSRPLQLFCAARTCFSQAEGNGKEHTGPESGGSVWQAGLGHFPSR